MKKGQVNEKLVSDAVSSISKICIGIHKSIIEVGQILIKMFDITVEAKKEQVGKKASYAETIKQLSEKPNMPSKSWYYTAIRLARVEEQYKGKKSKIAKLYLSLNQSHKQALLKCDRYGILGDSARKKILQAVVDGKIEITDIPKQVTAFFDSQQEELLPKEKLKNASKDKVLSAAESVAKKTKSVETKLEKLKREMKAAEVEAKDYVEYQQYINNIAEEKDIVLPKEATEEETGEGSMVEHGKDIGIDVSEKIDAPTKIYELSHKILSLVANNAPKLNTEDELTLLYGHMKRIYAETQKSIELVLSEAKKKQKDEILDPKDAAKAAAKTAAARPAPRGV